MTVATLQAPNFTLVAGNSGGAIQQLPAGLVAGGRSRKWIEQITLAAQANGAVIAVARVPCPCAITGIRVMSSVSLGSATLEFGDANNAALYAAAATFTSTTTEQLPAATPGVGAVLNSGYDGVTGVGGKAYEDVLMTVGTAALPGAGTLTVIVEWAGV